MITVPGYAIGQARDGTAKHTRLVEHLLVCLPHAGGSAAAYRSWREIAPSSLGICAIEMRGRLSRIDEAPHQTIDAIVEELAYARPWSLAERWSLFGHSMGAVVAFELVRRLRASSAALPSHVIVSGHRAPHLPDTRSPIAHLADGDFLRELSQFGGLPEIIMTSCELRELVLPALRADVQAIERYRYRPAPPLDVPITALAGADDPFVTRSQLAGWIAHTDRAFRIRTFPGGHFYMHDHAADVLETVLNVVRHAV